MDNALPFPSGPHGPAAPGLADQASHGRFAELLARNQEMIEQLRLERLCIGGAADFITRMIEQHEKTAALLRLQLENLESPSDSARTAADFEVPAFRSEKR